MIKNSKKRPSELLIIQIQSNQMIVRDKKWQLITIKRRINENVKVKDYSFSIKVNFPKKKIFYPKNLATF